MPLPTTLDELGQALAHRDTVREAERQLPDLQKASARSSVATQLQTVGSAESVRATLKALNADDKPVFRERFRAVCEFAGIKLADYLA